VEAAQARLVLGAANMLGYALSGGDEDDERKLLPEEKAGRILGFLGPKLVRMPWNDAHGSPVFLDIRRFIPLGDIVDFGQTHSALPIPPAAVPGGPLALLAEFLRTAACSPARTIVKDTDTAAEAAGKVFGLLLALDDAQPGGRARRAATDAVVKAGTGETDAFGRELSLAQALLNAVGIKLGSYPPDVLQRNLRSRRASTCPRSAATRPTRAGARSAAISTRRSCTASSTSEGRSASGSGRLPRGLPAAEEGGFFPMAGW
jgi:hypothetical protein